MSLIEGKKIILVVTGGIAAYKTTFLVRLFIKRRCHVRVVMTESATKFVTPLTLATLSKNPVHISFIKQKKEEYDWENHVHIAHWADIIVVSPATSNTLAKMVSAQVDNLAMAVLCSAKCPIYVAPAMDLEMYEQQGTQKNIEFLKQNTISIIPAQYGELASGLIGQGRMAEPEAIVQKIENDLYKNAPFRGKKILITAGPTYEELDPVRFLGNYSSGKMGYALAEVCAIMGATVTLVSGPTTQKVQNSSIRIEHVISTLEMKNVVDQYYSDSHVVIAAAAVADYRPKTRNQEKIKKQEDNFILELVKNPDILFELGQTKKHQFLVGFALETENPLANAKRKMQKKNLDMIVLNSLKDPGSGFGVDTNQVTILSKNAQPKKISLKSKLDIAKDICNFIVSKL